MRFGIGLPTCTEGLMYPVPFADFPEVVELAQEAEALGYYAVMGNDHFTTPRYVRRSFDRPPRFYEPLITYAYLAARTERIKLMTGVLVLPMREPVLLAKQVATLDLASKGRVILGVGVGAYREELEAVFPDRRRLRRGELADEMIPALRALFTQRAASYTGRYVRFEDVELFPKPVQDPLPLYAAGNAPEAARRAGRYCEGWIPAVLSPDEVRQRLEIVREGARQAGRDLAGFDVAPQLVVAIGSTPEQARERLRGSQLFEHLVSLQRSTLRGQDLARVEERCLVGTPDQICRQVEAYRAAGVTHLSGLLFAADTLAEFREQMRLFGREVVAAFARDRAGGSQ